MSADRTTLGGDVPDAGTEQKRQRGDGVAELGAVVVDADDDSADRSEAVVVNRPPVSCSEWDAYGDTTVAEDNPAYDAEASVIVVAFRSDLERAHPEWDADEPLALPLDCKTYAFPPRRLRRVGHLHADEGDDSEADTTPDAPVDRLTDGQEALRERLEETADVDVEADPDDPEAAVLVVAKLGAEHTIAADGSVEGGPVADRLADVAAEYLGGEGR